MHIVEYGWGIRFEGINIWMMKFYLVDVLMGCDSL